MDENKEIQTPEEKTEVENYSETDTQDNLNLEEVTQDSSIELEQDSDVTDPLNPETDSSESDFTESEELTEQATAKRRIVQTPVIISFLCLIAAIIAFLVFAFFCNSSIIGSWALEITSSNDEATTDGSDSYYVFEKDGVLTIPKGTTQTQGKYTLGEDETGATVTISDITYNYKVTGNLLTGRHLELSIPDYDGALSFKEQKFSAPEMKVESDFKSNDKLCGKWEYKDESYGYEYTLEFNSDGTAAYIQEYDEVRLLIDGIYTYDDSTIVLKYNIGEDTEMELPYELDNDKLIILEQLEFSKSKN